MSYHKSIVQSSIVSYMTNRQGPAANLGVGRLQAAGMQSTSLRYNATSAAAAHSWQRLLFMGHIARVLGNLHPVPLVNAGATAAGWQAPVRVARCCFGAETRCTVKAESAAPSFFGAP